MKVLHISSSDTGGAGLAALRLHQSLKASGIDSKMLVSEKKHTGPDIIKAIQSPRFNEVHYPTNPLLKRTKIWLHKHGLFQTEMEQDAHKLDSIPTSQRSFFTSPITRYDLRSHPSIQEADILHLHWVEGFVDYRTFFACIGKPIVWTFHDENIGFGGFHYKRDFDQYYSSYKTIEDKYSTIKQKSLSKVKDLTMISLSEEMDRFCHEESFVRERPSVIIPNSVDFNQYTITGKAFAKAVFKIPEHSIVVMFCSYLISEPRKGLAELMEALEILNIPDLTLLIVGGGKLPRPTDLKVYRAGYVTNEDILSLMYSAADLFVMPSYQEAFAQTPLEAMSCGVPVVCFPVSGTSCLINKNNGVRCSDFTVPALVNGLQKAMTTHFDNQVIRQDVIQRFSPSSIADQYIKVYHEVIHHNS